MNNAKVADYGWFTALIAWVITNAAGISLALQWAVALAGIVAAIAAARYHIKAARKL